MIEDQQQPDRAKLYRFKLDKILGRGGSGTVYRAIDTVSGAILAVKLFHANFFLSRIHRRDFAKSVEKNFNKLSHPNVVRVYEFITGDEGDCLTMDYVDGPDLKKYIALRPWNLDERLVIAAQICNGLQYIHDHGITHHDLKPANILFTRRGQVKLSDYSLTQTSLISALLDGSTHDQITPMYIAPELIQKQKITPQSD
ncbi:MAG: serine/threonine protein kinase, partial [Candidatus Hydrogenedentes bacterium]|nr:serine/threonine protein kinase [Candidatus Hydrogenedentota bacterium]